MRCDIEVEAACACQKWGRTMRITYAFTTLVVAKGAFFICELSP